MAARATPAASSVAVSRPTICATAARPAATPSLLERGGDIRDMPVQAALREQGAGEKTGGKNPERQTQQLVLHHESDRADDCEQDQDRDNAGRSPFTLSAPCRD